MSVNIYIIYAIYTHRAGERERNVYSQTTPCCARPHAAIPSSPLVRVRALSGAEPSPFPRVPVSPARSRCGHACQPQPPRQHRPKRCAMVERDYHAAGGGAQRLVRRPDKSSSDEKSESSVVHSFLQWQTNSGGVGGGEAPRCAGGSGGPASASNAAWAGTPRGLLPNPKTCAEKKASQQT